MELLSTPRHQLDAQLPSLQDEGKESVIAQEKAAVSGHLVQVMRTMTIIVFNNDYHSINNDYHSINGSVGTLGPGNEVDGILLLCMCTAAW
jgi:hypothetical protein